MSEIRYDGETPLGEIHIVETKTGQLNVRASVFEEDEICAVLLATYYEFMGKLIKCEPAYDFNVIIKDNAKLIFKLVEEKNKLKEDLFLTYSEFGFDNLSDFRKQMRKNEIDLGNYEIAIKQAIFLLSMDGKGTKQQSLKLLKEVLNNASK